MAKEDETKKRAKTPTAQKREMQNKKKRLENRQFKSQVRTALRKFEDAVSKNNDGLIKETLSAVYGLMDKGVKKGIYKLNKASRTKSRLAAKAVSKA